MDKYLKIIRILEKEEITQEEEQYLDQRSNEDINIKYFIEIYAKLEDIVNSSAHIDSEILSEFILYYDGDMEAAEYIPIITDKIEDHLSECSKCNTQYIKLIKEYDDLDDYISKSLTTSEDIEFEDEPSIFARIRKTNFKTAFTAVILLVITYTGMMLTSNYTTLPYKKNIFEFKDDFRALKNKRTEETFSKGIDALSSEDYETAIGYFREDVIKHSIDSSIYYAHYLLGISYLKSSENNILGTFTSYDHIRTGEGIQNLLLALKENPAGENSRLSKDAHYYIAKGYLAIDEIDLAIEHLQIVIDMRGSYYSDAVKIIASIEESIKEG